MLALGRPPLPREHGAWAMLLTPPIIALFVGGWNGLGLMAVLGWFAAYSMRGPIEALRGQSASGRAGLAHAAAPVARFWLVLLALAAAGLLGPVLWLRPQTLLLLMGAGLLLGGVYWLAAQGETRSLLSGVLAVTGLMAGAPLYWLAAHGRVPAEGWLLTYGCFAFFGGSIFRVKAVARERRSPLFRWLSVAVHLLFVGGAGLLVWTGWADGWFLLALLVPLLWSAYGAVRGGQRSTANLGAVGKAEIWLTLLLASLLIISLRIPDPV